MSKDDIIIIFQAKNGKIIAEKCQKSNSEAIRAKNHCEKSEVTRKQLRRKHLKGEILESEVKAESKYNNIARKLYNNVAR